VRRHTGLRLLRLKLPPIRGQCRLRSALGRVFAHDAITFHTASLYPTLYRLETRGLIEGRWVERAGQRRRRYYRLTRTGRKALAKQRSTWDAFFVALDRVAGIRHA
jgi:DNA-binding PadR family transcriptional regulator